MSSATRNSAVQKERYRDFGEAVEASGMTHAEIARQCGVSRPYVTNLVARRFRPSARMIIKFSELLGVDPRAYR